MDLSVVEQRYRAVLAVERGEPKIVVATPTLGFASRDWRRVGETAGGFRKSRGGSS